MRLGLLFLVSLVFLSCESEIEVIPEAKIQIDNTRLLQGYPLTLRADLPGDIRNSDFEYMWDFGNDKTSKGPEVNHTYGIPGSYSIRLTITGETGSETDVRMVEVKASLELVESFDLRVDEPSGLTFGLNNESLWTVSDRTGKIYQIDLHGNHLRTLDYYGGDLEGISFDTRDSSFWVVDESSGNIIHIDSSGTQIEAQWIAGVSDGGGLEGISIDSARSRLFLIKEKDNSALVVLDDSLRTTSYERIGFAPDYSGIYYSTISDQLWLLSHETSSVYLTDTSGNLIETYGFDLEQPEGIVFDELDSVFYIVDDTKEHLYKYQFWD